MGNIVKKNYQMPTLDLTTFESEDVIRTSIGVNYQETGTNWGVGNFDTPAGK